MRCNRKPSISASCDKIYDGKKFAGADIHHEVHAAYGQTIMSGDVVGHWVWLIKNRRTHIHYKEWSDRPSVIGNGIVMKIDEKVSENW